MKVYFGIFLYLFSIVSNSQEPKSFVGHFSSSRLSRYDPLPPCKEKVYLLCDNWLSGYYVYTLKPISSVKAPRKISITMESHTLRIFKSDNLWLIRVKDLDPVVARKTGAKFEVVGYALINGDTCSETSLIGSPWLFPTDIQLEEFRNERNDYCYKSVKT